MRFGIGFLFAAFYISSSFTTTQDRIVNIVDTLHHSSARPDDVSAGDAGKLRVPYTHFREAQKPGSEFHFSSGLTLRLDSQVSFRQFHSQVFSFKSQFDLETSHSRAPPFGFNSGESVEL